MFHTSRDHEDVASMQADRPGAAVRIPDADVEVAVQHEEELISVVVDVPDILALDLGDSYVVVVDARNDARAPQSVERRKCSIEVDGFVSHAASLPQYNTGASRCG
jgi:hypothetical protein